MSDLPEENKSIAQELNLAWKLIRDPDTPIYLKLLPVAAAAYFFFPEFFIGGPLLVTPVDDVAVLYAALHGLIGLAPADVVARYTGEGAQLNYVDGEYAVLDEDMASDGSTDSAEKSLADDIVINPDKHDW